MPATITHSYFATDVYDILSDDIKDTLDIDRLKMFAQAFDPIKFYNLFSILPGKKMRKMDFYFHTHNTRDFFKYMLKYMKTKKLIKDKDCCSFLAGFICHYVLDSTIHPYVIYKTGNFKKEDKSTYKYNNVHTFMETFIDNDMVKRRENINPYKFPLSKFCFKLNNYSLNLDYLINYTFYKTYNLKDMSNVYYKSLRQMRNALVTFRKDRFGIKKNIYKLVDTFTSKKRFRFEAISYHYPLEDRHNFLNSNHNLWRNPTTYDMTSTESFLDLYLKSIKKAEEIISKSYSYLAGEDINLDEVFLNISYITGIDCDSKKELKYFEF